MTSQTTSIGTSANGSVEHKTVVIDDRRNTNWPNVLFYIYLHLSAIYGILLICTEAHLATTCLTLVICVIAPYGVTMGAHRLWAHKSYSASLPLRVLLCFLHTLNAQGTVYDWVVEHRLHHKYRGTPQDPFNHSRGFFFAHINNKFKIHSPEREQLEMTINMKDIDEDAVITFQRRFYWILMPILSFLLPVNAPVEYWGENVMTSLCVVGLLRHVILLNIAWLVHSGPVLWTLKQGENESDSNLVFLIHKSRWHDYHYMFPWDYRTSEYGTYGCDSVTRLIEFAEKQGWASGLRTCSDETLAQALDIAMDHNLPLSESVERAMAA